MVGFDVGLGAQTRADGQPDTGRPDLGHQGRNPDARERYNERTGANIQVRVGVHSGPVVAGVIGRKKFMYDLWGDTVNTASRMESNGVPGAVQITAQTRDILGDAFRYTDRGHLDIKGKGKLPAYLLEPHE